MGKLVFDASIEKIKCFTQHEDHVAHTNESVLADVALLLREKNIAVLVDNLEMSRFNNIVYITVTTNTCLYKHFSQKYKIL